VQFSWRPPLQGSGSCLHDAIAVCPCQSGGVLEAIRGCLVHERRVLQVEDFIFVEGLALLRPRLSVTVGEITGPAAPLSVVVIISISMQIILYIVHFALLHPICDLVALPFQ
jgi:hypothetical protein